jgi:hypothetical protein
VLAEDGRRSRSVIHAVDRRREIADSVATRSRIDELYTHTRNVQFWRTLSTRCSLIVAWRPPPLDDHQPPVSTALSRPVC